MAIAGGGQPAVEDQLKQPGELLPREPAGLRFERGPGAGGKRPRLQPASPDGGWIPGDHVAAVLPHAVPDPVTGRAAGLIPAVPAEQAGNVFAALRPHAVAQFLPRGVSLPLVGHGNAAHRGVFQFDHSKVHFLRSFDGDVKGDGRIEPERAAAFAENGRGDAVLPAKGPRKGGSAVVAVFDRQVDDRCFALPQLLRREAQPPAPDVFRRRHAGHIAEKAGECVRRHAGDAGRPVQIGRRVQIRLQVIDRRVELPEHIHLSHLRVESIKKAPGARDFFRAGWARFRAALRLAWGRARCARRHDCAGKTAAREGSRGRG